MVKLSKTHDVEPMKIDGKRLGERSALLHNVRVLQKRAFRCLLWLFWGKRYRLSQRHEALTFCHARHSSKLIRRFGDDPCLEEWQQNKVHNLRLALERLDGLLIKPGQTFSFCKTVGRPTRAKGYVEGMELSRGKARAGVGGGLCQLSNMLNWLAWHSPLEIIERSTHSFDPFPDDGRILPFGSGAAIFWNYVDLRIHNPTPHTFQIKMWLDDNLLWGQLRCEEKAEFAYHVFQKNHDFFKVKDEWWRRNEIWRTVHKKGRGGKAPVFYKEELLVKNKSRVCYVPESGDQNAS